MSGYCSHCNTMYVGITHICPKSIPQSFTVTNDTTTYLDSNITGLYINHQKGYHYLVFQTSIGEVTIELDKLLDLVKDKPVSTNVLLQWIKEQKQRFT